MDITMMPFCVELVSLILGPFILLFIPRCRFLTIRGSKQTSPIWTASFNDVQSGVLIPEFFCPKKDKRIVLLSSLTAAFDGLSRCS